MNEFVTVTFSDGVVAIRKSEIVSISILGTASPTRVIIVVRGVEKPHDFGFPDHDAAIKLLKCVTQ